ncbi:MAG: dipeptidase [Aggregatilineales bacterium]
MTSAIDYAHSNFDRFQSELVDLLKIPSVSTDPAYKDDMYRAANWLADHMRGIKLENVEVMETGGHPLVYADWLHAGDDAPTVLIYGHYDVQPAVMEDGWSHNPFDPQIRDGKIFARGATDDKGQVMLQLKAAESLLATDSCPVNLKYLIEGEEESGSENLERFIREHQDLLAADVCVISDTGITALEEPSLVYGLRGSLAMELVVSGPRQDLHSGLGGILHNPVQALTEIVSKLHDETGKVTVPGFYDNVADVSDEERAMLNKLVYSEDQWTYIMGDLPEYGEAGYTIIERMGIRPTLEINGIAGGYAGTGFKTVIGASAIAKISCRLVPNQDPARIKSLIQSYIDDITPDTVRSEINFLDGTYPVVTDMNHPAVQAVIRAYSKRWQGKDVLLTRIGGSIPVVANFQTILDIPVVLPGFALPDANMHGPDENFYLEMYHRGIDTIITLMQELAG